MKASLLPWLRESIPADCGMDATLPRHEGNEARAESGNPPDANLKKLRPKPESSTNCPVLGSPLLLCHLVGQYGTIDSRTKRLDSSNRFFAISQVNNVELLRAVTEAAQGVQVG